MKILMQQSYKNDHKHVGNKKRMERYIFAFILEIGFFYNFWLFSHRPTVLARVACDGLTRYFLARPFSKAKILAFRTRFWPKAILTGKSNHQSFIWPLIWQLSCYISVVKTVEKFLNIYVKVGNQPTARHDFMEKQLEQLGDLAQGQGF